MEYLYTYHINWWFYRISEPSTVGKKASSFERLLLVRSLRTSVARPKSCGALPAMNGTATSGKDLKILQRWGSWIFFVFFFKPEMIEVFCWKKMPNHKTGQKGEKIQVDHVNSLGCLVGLLFPVAKPTEKCLAGLPSSRVSNDLTPTASLPLLVPTPIVSPAERSPTGLGFPESQRVEFCQEMFPDLSGDKR